MLQWEPGQQEMVKNLAEVAGEEILKKAYFGGDVDDLKKAIDNKKGSRDF